MKSVRRLYIYLVTFISLEVVAWGLIGLLRTIFSTGLAFQGADTLSQALALILVGIPIFGLHWYWAQHAAAEEEEQISPIRGVFFYAALLATLIPVAQNLLALVNRSLILSTGINSYFSFVGGSQSNTDNLIAIGLNLVLAFYFYRSLTKVSYRNVQDHAFEEIFRLYAYIWVVYSLFLTLFGTQEVIRFIFSQPGIVIGPAGKEYFLNGLAMILVGTPLWVYSWNHRQAIDQVPTTQSSPVRLVFMFLLSIIGVITVLVMGSLAIYDILLPILGEQVSIPSLLARLGNPISVGVSLSVLWLYYGHWFKSEVDSRYQGVYARSILRMRQYLLSLIGLVATIVALILMVAYVVNVTSGTTFWGENLRTQVAGAVATLATALPLWVIMWQPLQTAARLEDELGTESRGSVIRRAYLYIAVFASVIGGMVSAIRFFNTLLFGLLDHQGTAYLPNLFENLSNVAIFVVVLLYHLGSLRKDGRYPQDHTKAVKGSATILALLRREDPRLADIKTAAQKTQCAVEVADPESATIDQLQNYLAIIVDSDAVANTKLSTMLSGFEGTKLILPAKTNGYHWLGTVEVSTKEIEHTFRLVSSGKEIRPYRPTSAWQVIANVAAVIFGLELLLMAFGLLMSLIFGG